MQKGKQTHKHIHATLCRSKANIRIRYETDLGIIRESQITVINVLRALVEKSDIQEYTDSVKKEIETLRMNKNESTPKHFLVKLQKFKIKEKMLKGIKEKKAF